MPWIKCLGSRNESVHQDSSLRISQPIHLLIKDDYDVQCHIFRTKQLRKPRPCQLCHQAMIKQASCCRVCKYVCHKACENKGTRFRDTSQQIHKQWQADPTKAFPSVGNATSPTLSHRDDSSTNSTPSPPFSPTDDLQNLHNGSHELTKDHICTNYTINDKKKAQSASTASSRTPGVGADAATITATGKGGRVSQVMELCYVTERIIALWYREDAHGVLEHATNLLQGKHADNYMIFNLSSPGKIGDAHIQECGWPQGLAPSLEKLCALCKGLDSWLNSAPNRVVVLHARGAKERLGVAVSAYMNYSNICGGQDQALDRFAMRKFLDDKIGPLRVPSHRRYIDYFSGLLAGPLRINPSSLYLTHITVLSVPHFEATGCRAFLKVYEGLTPVYTSDLYSVTNAREFTVNLGRLRLRGDILIKCYHRIYSKQKREVMFSLQFHTCVITENVVSFPRSELDIACHDARCPSDSVVTLYFAADARRQDGPIPAPTPAVPHASAHHDPILQWDSYANLDMTDGGGWKTSLSPPPPGRSSLRTSPQSLGYTCGPIDGSLYAIVHQSAAGAARGSPLTVSMDSGISSAPPQRSSPPENNLERESPEAHRDLDKLLHDMMMTVESMPDPPSLNEYNRNNELTETNIENGSDFYNTGWSMNSMAKGSTYRNTIKNSSTPCSTNSNFGYLKNELNNSDGYSKKSFSPTRHIDFIDDEIPYHARQTSQPFSYGATNEMIKQQKLSSPSLVRKAAMRSIATNSDIDDIECSTLRRPLSPPSYNAPELSQEHSNGILKPTDDTLDGLSWLKQQQIKLAARKDEQSPGSAWRQQTGNRIIGELRNMQKGRLRQDGYASDSAVLDDDADVWISNTSEQTSRASYTSAPASPLLPHRSSSHKFNGTIINDVNGRPRAESVNERPFVSVKRSYELRKRSDSQSPPSSPHTAELLGVAYHQFQSNSREKQPPRPESRSDSYAKAEILLREYRYLNGSSHQETDDTGALKQNVYLTSQSSLAQFHPNESNGQSHVIYDNSKDVIDSGVQTFGPDKSNGSSDNVFFTFVESLDKIPPALTESSTNNNHENLLTNINFDTIIEFSNPSININNNDGVNDTNSILRNQIPKAWQFNAQSQNNSSMWADRSISPIGIGIGNISRPQTPAFPVHPRTPYVNNSSPIVTFATDRTCIASNINESSNYSVQNNNIQSMDHSTLNTDNNLKGYVTDRTGYNENSREAGLPPKSPTAYRKERPISPTGEFTLTNNRKCPNSETFPTVELLHSPKSTVSFSSITSGNSSPQVQVYNSRRSSIHSNTEPQEVADVNVKFVRDTSKIWYKPNISREQAIAMLKDATPGTFVVRDSNSFPGAFGLALKVATPPLGVPSSPKDPSNELVRHFLIEPTSRGVRLKGCANEPVFSSLSALVYQHSLMAMALPCQLLLPEPEAAARALDSPTASMTQHLLAQGAACNVLYLFTMDTESLTGPQAIKKAITTLFDQKPMLSATIVHFKVSTQGITLTDNARKIFFRRHYPTNNISYCGVDVDERTWNTISSETGKPLSVHRCFGFVARKPAHKSDNQCHIFAELEPGQPATAIVNFVNKVMMESAATKVNVL